MNKEVKKYNLSGMVTVSVYTEVEAETLEQAIEIARERDLEYYRMGDKYQSTQSWVNSELDGEVHSIENN